MGGFYLDIIKDRQYTTQADSDARRSAQTAMYHIVQALARWLMPVLSFTAEDIWQRIPGERGDSVLLEQWYKFPSFSEKNNNAMGSVFWTQVITLREEVGKQLETLRIAGDIGSSLAAEVDLYCTSTLFDELAKLEDELRFVLITSYARIHPVSEHPADAIEMALDEKETVWISVKASAHDKCVRCWHHRKDVGIEAEHPELCGRCVENVAGAGETRRYA